MRKIINIIPKFTKKIKYVFQVLLVKEEKKKKKKKTDFKFH